ncbi:hypothetical protein EV198_0447 [Roseivirga ehrenbergii]|uniref:Uncharacterized protein n=1 Tax=Roseivirga ehrenbergii (strain DSM 102268 / JCM 13514 / KCTC 12282 / NCIMB 14502 / KMM 6017) TaxID=279360 RepID=A0A150X8H8_ROSEK|nr:hypothetical protein [Roseivirga ehrenbergii]KYG75028.1 hypothetical protein MB14_07465 [Roseivirga ehrenbergii]TCL13617.1 hypothetical protein EV198_0447 [Roseivirga ehrenbergii]
MEEMSDREMLEFVYSSQVVLMGMIQRIENHLSKDDEEGYRKSDTRSHLEVHDYLKIKVDQVQTELNIRAIQEG